MVSSLATGIEEEAEMSSLQAADTSTDDDSSDEAGPDSLLQKHKDLIDKCREVLCGLLDPSQVILQLRKQGVFTQLDQQTILARPTDLERNGHILDQLFRRGPHALHEFVRCLKSFEDKYSSIAYTLQPVNHRILWFASSPTLAAAVVHTLEEYNAAKFPEFPGKMGPKSKYIVRRASVFVKWIPVEDSDLDDSLDIFDCVDDIEVCLVFPTAEISGHVTEAMTAAFRECPRPSIAVMSGMCEDVGALDVGSDVIIVNSVRTQFPQIDLDLPTTEIAKKTIQTKFTRPTEWSKRFTRRHSVRPKEPLMNCIDTNPPQPLDTSLHTTYVSDDGHTHQFYELCRSKLPGETPFLATVGVVNKECPEETRSSYAVLSSIVTMEICRTFMEKH